MNLYRTRAFLFFLLVGSTALLYSQGSGFDSFISRITTTYNVDLALAPELIPALDSIRNFEPGINNIEELLHKLLEEKAISYQIVDGNKLMLRREPGIQGGAGLKLLKGTIVDGRDGSPLPFAAVSLMRTNRGSFTDENGRFTLPVEDTTGAVMVNYLGFKPLVIPITAFSGSEQNVRMEINNIPLKQVIIVVPFQQMSVDEETQSIDLKGYQFISAKELLNGNTEHLINNLTGYTHYSSEQGIRIRGSEAENSLIVMDGLPVYDPYHYYNIFNAFNGHYFSSVELFKNNMPVEYGGRIDGLININSDHGSPGSKLILDTDLLLSSLTYDWYITPKVKFTGGGRVSHTGLLNEALRDSSVANFSLPGRFKGENEWSSSQQPTFDFYDVNLGFHASLSDHSYAKASYFRNKDHLENFIQTVLETTFPGNESVSVQQSIVGKDKWNNEGLAIDIRSRLQHKSVFNFNGFITSFVKSASYSSTLQEHYPNMDKVSFNSGFQESHLQTAGLKAFISSDSSGHEGYKIGVDLQRHAIDLLAEEDNMPYLKETQREYESTLFGEYRFTVFGNLDWTLGARMTYLNSTSRIYPQPNLQLNYLLNDHWKLKASYSKNIQAIQQVTVENRFGREIDFMALSQPDAGYPLLRSDKYMTGVNYASNNLNVDVELFYKKINGLINVRALKPDPSFHNETSPVEFYRLFTGNGWTAGMDLLIVYKKNNFESAVSYTLSKISERFERLFNGNSFSPQEDRRHQIKLSSQYRMGKFTASSLLSYKTKAPYLSFVRLNGKDGIGMVDQGKVLRYLPPYFSLDLGLDYSFTLFRQPAQMGISVINATNHKNINDLQHVGFVSKEGSAGGVFLTNETELLGRTVNIHFRYLIQ